MRVYRDKTLTNQEFIMEDVSFINCHVRDCDLFYSGGDFDWQGGQFQNCRFHFRGAAKNMLTLCQMIGMIQTPQTQLSPTNLTPPKPN
jgi:hypothetical protein